MALSDNDQTIADYIVKSGGQVPIGIDPSNVPKDITMEVLRQYRDAEQGPRPASEVEPRQQTIVGEHSGVGNRHVIRRPMDFGPLNPPKSLILPEGITVKCETIAELSGGETEINDVNTLVFDDRYFKIHDDAEGRVQISLNTTDCA